MIFPIDKITARQGKNLRTRFICPAICLLLPALCFSNQIESMQSCLDPTFGFRLSCPDSGWSMTDETGIRGVVLIVKSGSVVDGFIPNVTVTVESLPRMLTAGQYGAINSRDLTAQGYTIESTTGKAIGGNLFSLIECSLQTGEYLLHFQFLCLVKDRIGYLLTCSAPAVDFMNFHADFERIVNSFDFLP